MVPRGGTNFGGVKVEERREDDWSEHRPLRLEVKQLGTRPDRMQSRIAIASVLLVAAGIVVNGWFSHRQQALDERGQITDRLSAAIDELGQSGADKVENRLGAVYALRRLMIDSPEDEPNVIQVLVTFIRIQSPVPNGLVAAADASYKEPKPSSADVVAALVVLGRRPDPGVSQNQVVDLRGSRLAAQSALASDVFFYRTYLAFADFREADLRKANFHFADLSGANLRDVQLKGANLIGARLVGASFDGAHVEGADLRDAVVTTEQLRCVYADRHTRLPDGVKAGYDPSTCRK
jgi:hypothetical protein